MMESALFHNDEEGRKAFVQLAHKAIAWIETYYRDMETYPVRSQVQPGDVYDQFPDKLSPSPGPVDDVFRILNEVILPGITHWQHPNFYAFFPSNTSFPAISAEMITAGIAAQCMIWESSPAAAELEQRCMEWCRDLLGLPKKWEGAIQDTASTATLTALLTAREWKSGFSICTKGFDGSVYRIYTSTQAHSSVEKAVRLAGFGTHNLVYVGVDATLRMVPERLDEAIKNDLLQGYIPVCVVSTIGTTGTGAIDPIESIGKITRQYGLWHHIDAAYAGSAMMLDEYAHLRSGLDNADSFVFNPHKWMFVPFDCSAYYVRDPGLLVRTMSINPTYLATSKENKVNDYRNWGIPLGRRFRALKLWMTMQLIGTDAVKARIRHHITLAEIMEDKLLAHPALELAYPRSLNILSFRIKADLDPEGHQTRQLYQMINESGKAYVTHTVVEGRSLIRFVPGQTYTEQRHIHDTFHLIESILDRILNA